MFKNSNRELIVVIAIYFLVALFPLLKGAIYYPDSYAFLRMDFNRSLVYCLFLKANSICFGTFYELPVIIFQYTFIVLGINYLINTIKDIFHIRLFGLAIIQIILLVPCISSSYIANMILSEALCYPLVLIVIGLSLKLVVNEDLKYIYKIFPFLLILILTRGQFIAFVPVLLLLILFIIWKHKFDFKKGISIVLILLIPIFSNVIEKIYNKVTYGYFINNSMSYVHLISASFYISDGNDVNIFKTEDEKQYFKQVYSSLVQAKLTRNQALELDKDEYRYYEDNFSNICNERVHEIGLNIFKRRGLNFYEQNIALNKMCSSMLLPLLKQNSKKWIVFYCRNLKNSFGNSKQVIMYFILLIYGMLFLFKTNKNVYKFIVVTLLFMFANNGIIALVVHSINRYIFYFDWVIFVIIFILLNDILKKELNES
jgi:hypothetical protein